MKVDLVTKTYHILTLFDHTRIRAAVFDFDFNSALFNGRPVYQAFVAGFGNSVPLANGDVMQRQTEFGIVTSTLSQCAPIDASNSF